MDLRFIIVAIILAGYMLFAGVSVQFISEQVTYWEWTSKTGSSLSSDHRSRTANQFGVLIITVTYLIFLFSGGKFLERIGKRFYSEIDNPELDSKTQENIMAFFLIAGFLLSFVWLTGLDDIQYAILGWIGIGGAFLMSRIFSR